jgi:acyl-CoA thioesterase-1
MMRALALVCLCAAASARAQAAPPSLACPPLEDAGIQRGELPHLAAALKPGGTLNVLVVGPGAEAPAHAPPASAAPGFPLYMAQTLQSEIPRLRVNLVAVGGHGQAASVMLGVLRTALDRRPYQVVLWQTGTVDAVSMVAPEDFYQTLEDGAGMVSALGADLILVGPQYSRFLEDNANMAPYLAALQEAAALPGVALFDRFGIMHDWVEAGALDLEHAAKIDRPALAARLHQCLGRYLAQALLRPA